jgi:hypothetical protein
MGFWASDMQIKPAATGQFLKMTTFCIVFYESYHSRQTVTMYDVANL